MEKMQLSLFIDNKLKNFASPVVSSLQKMRVVALKIGIVLSFLGGAILLRLAIGNNIHIIFSPSKIFFSQIFLLERDNDIAIDGFSRLSPPKE